MSLVHSEPVRYRAAGFWRRLLAVLLDALFLGPFWLLSFVAIYGLAYRGLPAMRQLTPDLFVAFLIEKDQFVGKAVLILMAFSALFYSFVFHALWGKTPGKRIVGIRVVDVYGQRIGFLRSFFRTIMACCSFVLLGAGLLWCAFDVKRRALHDHVAGTHVVVG